VAVQFFNFSAVVSLDGVVTRAMIPALETYWRNHKPKNNKLDGHFKVALITEGKLG
jgi:hypothetical protein